MHINFSPPEKKKKKIIFKVYKLYGKSHSWQVDLPAVTELIKVAYRRNIIFLVKIIKRDRAGATGSRAIIFTADAQ